MIHRGLPLILAVTLLTGCEARLRFSSQPTEEAVAVQSGPMTSEMVTASDILVAPEGPGTMEPVGVGGLTLSGRNTPSITLKPSGEMILTHRDGSRRAVGKLTPEEAREWEWVETKERLYLGDVGEKSGWQPIRVGDKP